MSDPFYEIEDRAEAEAGDLSRPKPEDYGFAPGDRRAEEIMFEVKREFARME